MKNIRTSKKRNKMILGIILIVVILVMFFCQYIYGGKHNDTVKVDDISNSDNISSKIVEETDENSKNQGQNNKVENDYFSDAVFIGDSRTQGLMLYTGLKDTTFYAEVGLQVDTIFTKEYITKPNGENLTIMQDLATKDFSKVYIMLGVNELGWVYDSVFISKYSDIIDAIRSINEDAIIYVQSIVYVTKEKSESDKIYNNTNIERFNSKIIEMCNKKNVKYLDINSCLKDENNCLPSDASVDGVHLNKTYCKKWLEYLKENI